MTNSVVIKKYGNRRLYDTYKSAYVTLEQVADDIRRGSEIKVVDAKTGQDLTQATLAQIILEGRKGADLLPVPLLVQLVRMGDDAFGEFFGRWLAVSLQMYVQMKQNTPFAAPMNPFGQLPFQAGDAFARMFQNMPGASMFGWPGTAQNPAPSPGPATPPPPAAGPADDVASLRRELDELKVALRRKRR